MASVKKRSNNRGYRVAYSLKIPGLDNPVRRSRFPRSHGEAQAMRAQLDALEQAARTGMAPLDQIEDWIHKGWIKQDEAFAVFRGYRTSSEVHSSDLVPVDWDLLRRTYEDYALDHSKARDATRKTHRSHMYQADRVIEYLQEHHPTLILTSEDIERWMDGLRAEGKADWSLHHYLTRVRLILDQAVKLKMIYENPARQVTMRQPKRTTTRRVLTVEEAQHLLAVAPNYTKRISGCLPSVVYLGLYAGLRDEEMCWAQWEWLDTRRGLLTVQEAKSVSGEKWIPKDAEARILDIKKPLVDHLNSEHKRQEQEGIECGFVIPGGNTFNKAHFRGRPITSDRLQDAFREMIKAEGMDSRITIYSLRHTYCTMLLRGGGEDEVRPVLEALAAGRAEIDLVLKLLLKHRVDLKTVQARMGHSDIRTTMSYQHEIDPEQHPTDALPY